MGQIGQLNIKTGQKPVKNWSKKIKKVDKMILKLKESNFEPEKNGLMIHISNVNIQGISDLKGFAELKKNQKLFHYIILLDKEAKPHLLESLKPNEDTNLEFKNYDTILKLKEILKSRELDYNRINLEYLVEELRVGWVGANKRHACFLSY